VYRTNQAVDYCYCGSVLFDGEDECEKCARLPKRCCVDCAEIYVVINDSPRCAECHLEMKYEEREARRESTNRGLHD
jgi:hypothetical protein